MSPTPKQCSVDGCRKPCRKGSAKGLCTMHYQRLQRGADLIQTCADCAVVVCEPFRKRCRPCAAAHKRQYISDWQRMSVYGIAPEEFRAKLAAQGHVCAVCGTDKPGNNGWCLDHDHALPSNDPASHRGVLCRACNHMLGNAKDSVAILSKGAQYLRRAAARLGLGVAA